VEIHRSLEHPNVAVLMSYVLEIDYTALVIEYLPNVMYELVRREHRSVLDHLPDYHRQILLALAYLHSVGVAHRDIKLENILVTADRKVAKLCDFGLATFFSAGDKCAEYCGSPHYAAPEILMGTPYNPAATDMWSCGVVLFAMVFAVMPFNHNGDLRILLRAAEKVVFPKHPANQPNFVVPTEWRTSAEKLLHKQPTQRPTAAQVLADPWLTPR
jgi:serine/threonine-protein kinase HSL1, negative regulator of Swe1 kinase